MINAIKNMFKTITEPSAEILALEKMMEGSKLDGCTPWSYLRSFSIYFKDHRGYLKFDYNAISKRYEGYLWFYLDGQCIALVSEYELGFSGYVNVALKAHPEISTIVKEFQLKYEKAQEQKEKDKQSALEKVLQTTK